MGRNGTALSVSPTGERAFPIEPSSQLHRGEKRGYGEDGNSQAGVALEEESQGEQHEVDNLGASSLRSMVERI